MRVLLLTHFFPPEIGPAQGRLLETAKDLTAAGHEVVVLTTFPNYPTGEVAPEYRGQRLVREEIDGIRVVRSWLYSSSERGVGQRSISHISFAISSVLAAARLDFRPEVVAVDMHPIFLCVSALVLSRLWRVPYVLNACDLIPDQAVAYGVVSNRILVSATRWLARMICRNASMVVPFTRGILSILAERGIPSARLELIYYGVDRELFEDRARWARLPPSLASLMESRFVVTYAGNLGSVYALDCVIEAASLLASHDEIRFLLVGDGSERHRLMRRVHELGLGNVALPGQLPRDAMPALYEASDLCLVSIRQSEFIRRAALSSKVFEGMAAGRAIIVSGEGETADLVREADAGLVVPPETPRRLAAAIDELSQSSERRRRLGQNGRVFSGNRFSRARRSKQYESVLLRAIDSH